MDNPRLAFVFGDADLAGVDLTDPDVRSELVEELLDDTFDDEDLSETQLVVRRALANQVLNDDPPETWAAVQRTQAAGRDRAEIFRDLSLALTPRLLAALDGNAFDRAAYLDALAGLPLPSTEEFERAVVEAVRADQGAAWLTFETAVLERLGRAGDEVAERMLGHVYEELDRRGTLLMLPPDRVVEPAGLAVGCTFTHRVTADEIEAGLIDASIDFELPSACQSIVTEDGREVDTWSTRTKITWLPPEGWLGQFAPGGLLAAAVSADGQVVTLASISADDEPAGQPERLRAVYDVEIEEIWMPAESRDLAAALLVEDRSTFATPGPPFRELCAAAGLEIRAREVAHDDSVWHEAVRSSRFWRLTRQFESPATLAIARALDVADLVAGVPLDWITDVDRPVDAAMVRSVLDSLDDPDVLMAFVHELLDGDEPGGPERADAFVAAALDAADRPRRRTFAHYLAAVRAERLARPVDAEQHLRRSYEATTSFAPAISRLAWYASMRGDAAAAISLLRRLEPTSIVTDDIALLGRYTGAQRDLGRNERCWCGSGRKYKHCHLGVSDLSPLPDRVAWLLHKASTFLRMRGPETQHEVVGLAFARSPREDDPDDVLAATHDPIVIDLVLHELGWFEVFLDEFGELLPADEALMARSWTLVNRSVYEVLDVRPGVGFDVRDLRTGDRMAVQERTLSDSITTSALICTRVVPVGTEHQIIGGVSSVRPGHERTLLDLLDEGDPDEIAEWVAALDQPPRLSTREGEPMVECEVVVDARDGDLVAFLDEHYERDDADDATTWRELFPLNDDERILRATLTMDGTRVTVQTHSEPRVERVLSALHERFPESVVVSDRRTPLDVETFQRRAAEMGHTVPSPPEGNPATVAALSELRDRFEERWCDESVPALGGLTPREAALDPTRREEVVRLIASFEHMPMGDLGMRPDRLRELLGL